MSFARVRALVVVGVLAVAAIVFVVVALVRDSQGGAVNGEKCPAGAPMADVTLPDEFATQSSRPWTPSSIDRNSAPDVLVT